MRRSSLVVAFALALAFIGGTAVAGGPRAQLQQIRPSHAMYVEETDFLAMDHSGTGNVAGVVDVAANLGCDPGDFASFRAGSIALISRGQCTFAVKTDNAEAAGAVAVLVYNNVPGVFSGTLVDDKSVPVAGVSQEVGQELLAAGGLRMRLLVREP